MSGMRSNEFGEASSSSPSRSTSSSLHNFFPGESSSSSSLFSYDLRSLNDALLFNEMRMHQHTADHFANTGIDDSRICEIFNQLNIKRKAKIENQFDPLGNFGSSGFGIDYPANRAKVENQFDPLGNFGSSDFGVDYSSNRIVNSSHDIGFSSFAGTVSHINPASDFSNSATHQWMIDLGISSNLGIDPLSGFRGFIYATAKYEQGCHYLQRIIDEGTRQDFVTIFNEIGPYITDLMIHPCGNHLIQKILDFCTEEQITVIIRMATAKLGEFINISCNIYGTRVIQKLIRSIKTKVHISLVKSALRFGVFDLITDSNGNHVIQHCLRCFSAEDKKFIFDFATIFCTDIAVNEYGCFIIKKCIESSFGQQQQNLMVEISRNSLFLAQDPFGNYVVQSVIEQENSVAVSTILSQLRGHYVQLSIQKFSSHVVEKCLIHCLKSRRQIVIELITCPKFDKILQHPFANFVIQTALNVTQTTQGLLHRNLIEAIRPHEFLRYDPCCRKIFSRYFPN